MTTLSERLHKLADQDDVKANPTLLYAIKQAATAVDDFEMVKARLTTMMDQRDRALNDLNEMVKVKQKMEKHIGVIRSEIGDAKMRELLNKVD